MSVAIAPGTGSGFVGARADATLSSCEGAGGTWTAVGTVTNPTSGVVGYRIYVAFLSSGRATLGLLQVDAGPVLAGESATWRGSLPLSVAVDECVLRVERTPTAG